MYKKGWEKLKIILERNNELNALKFMDDIQKEIDLDKYICIKSCTIDNSEFLEGDLYEVVDQDCDYIWVEDENGEVIPFVYGSNDVKYDFYTHFKQYREYLKLQK